MSRKYLRILNLPSNKGSIMRDAPAIDINGLDKAYKT